MREGPACALVTGASSGIGRACTLWLANLGMRVFATLRATENAGPLARVRGVHLLQLDLCDPESIDRATSEVAAQLRGRGLDGLVHAAGIAVAGPLEFLPREALHEQLEVNLNGPLGLTQGLIPLLRRDGGRIVFVSSMSARVSPPFLGAYAASKFALEAVVDALRVELQPWRIHVCSVQPGRVATPLWRKSLERSDAMLAAAAPHADALYGRRLGQLRATALRVDAGRGSSPDIVARSVAHALTTRRPRTRYLVGRNTRLAAIALRLAPDRIRDLWLRTASPECDDPQPSGSDPQALTEHGRTPHDA
ncbi:MAG: SDR family oxidoreductase [Myxococcota bacterium]